MSAQIQEAFQGLLELTRKHPSANVSLQEAVMRNLDLSRWLEDNTCAVGYLTQEQQQQQQPQPEPEPEPLLSAPLDLMLLDGLSCCLTPSNLCPVVTFAVKRVQPTGQLSILAKTHNNGLEICEAIPEIVLKKLMEQPDQSLVVCEESIDLSALKTQATVLASAKEIVTRFQDRVTFVVLGALRSRLTIYQDRLFFYIDKDRHRSIWTPLVVSFSGTELIAGGFKISMAALHSADSLISSVRAEHVPDFELDFDVSTMGIWIPPLLLKKNQK